MTYRIYTNESAVIDYDNPDVGTLTDIRAELCIDSSGNGFDCDGRTRGVDAVAVGIAVATRYRGGCDADELCDLAEEESDDDFYCFNAMRRRGYLVGVSGDVVIIERVSVLDRYRGSDYGLRLIEAVLQTKPYELAGLLVAPTDYLCWPRIAKQKLRRHYGRLGFQTIARTDVMVLHHSNQRARSRRKRV